MATRHASALVDDRSLRQQVAGIRDALGDLVVQVDADTLLGPIAFQQQPGAQAAFTEVVTALAPSLSETIITARRDSR